MPKSLAPLRRLFLLFGGFSLLLSLSPQALAASVLAGWNVSTQPGGTNNWGTSPLAATASDPGVTVGGLTRGSGVGTSGSGAARGWGGNNWVSTSEAAAVTANQFATFSVTVNAGNAVSFSTVSRLDYRRSGTGASTGVLQYQIGSGAFTDITTISYTNTTSSGASAGPLDLSTVSALQNVAAGTTVTFRIVNWGGTGSTGTWYIFDVANSTASDLEIQGTVTPVSTATQVRVETAANGSGAVAPAQTIPVGNSVTVYSVTRDSSNTFLANAAAAWSLSSITGGIVAGDLVPSGDGKSAVFTPHASGSAVIHAVISGLTSVDSGVQTGSSTPTNPAVAVTFSPSGAAAGQTVTFTATVTPGTNPASSNLAVTADLSALGGSSNQAFTAGAGNTFTYQAVVGSGLSGGPKQVPVTVQDGQSRSGSATVSVNVYGALAIFHTNDMHARVTPHQWIIPSHTQSVPPQFETVGGVAYVAGEMLSLVNGQPDALVLDGGDVSEGNPLGDWNGPGNPVGAYGNGIIVDYYKMLDNKLKSVAARGGRGLDAMVVGNHDIRAISYLNNLKAAAQE